MGFRSLVIASTAVLALAPGGAFAADKAEKQAEIRKATNASLQKYGQTEKAVAVGEVYLVQGEGRERTGNRALVMTCADAVKLTRYGLTPANCAGGPAVFQPVSWESGRIAMFASFNTVR